MIVVTGASGQLGTAVSGHIRARGAAVLEGTRHPSPGSGRLLLDFDEPASLRLDGVDVLVLVSAGAAEDDVVTARHENAVAAAERDGVAHVIYTSLATEADHLGFALAHRWTERRIRSSALGWTILRNGLYAELFGQLLTPHDGVITAPFGAGSLAAVARNDLAEAAAIVAVDPAPHAGKVYDLVGTSPITAGQVAARIGADYRPTSLKEFRCELAQAPGLMPFQPPMLASIHSSVAHGFLGSTSPDLSALLERAPQDPLEVAAQAAGGL